MMDLSKLHLHWRSNTKKGIEYRSYSLARSYRDGGKVRKEIVLKLGKLSDEDVQRWRHLLQEFKNPSGMATKEKIIALSKDSDSSNKLLAMLQATGGKRFEYIEADRDADAQLYEEISQHAFAEVEDPRAQDNLCYPFYGTLLLILAGTIAGASSIRAIHEYTVQKSALLCPLIGTCQPPSYTSLWWIITRTNSAALNRVFVQWIRNVASSLGDGKKNISIDGKTLRGAKKSPVHYVSAFENNRGLLLGQLKTEEKSNEITTIPELLKVIDVNGAVVTIDAMGCQKEIVHDIRQRGGHYIIALKGNQGNLHAEVVNFFDQARSAGYKGTSCKRTTTTEKGHGRIEKREIVVTTDLEWLDCRQEWTDLEALIEVKSTRTIKGHTTEESRYYISSKRMKPKEAGIAIRQHWGIENRLHWVMDVVFDDDKSQANMGHAAENLGLFRRMAYCLLKQDTQGARGLASMQRKAMWNDDYVLHLLARFIQQASTLVDNA